MSESSKPTDPSSTTHQTTRDRILALAVAALEQGGEASIRVNDISSQANIAVTSIYHYFGNRDGLVAAAQVLRYRQSTSAEFEGAQNRIAQCTTKAEFREAIQSIVQSFLNSPSHERQRAVRVATYAAATTRPEIAALLPGDLESSSNNMYRLLEPLKVKGWIKPEVDTRAFGIFYLGVMTSRMLIEIGQADIAADHFDEFVLRSVLQVIPED